MSRYKLGVGDEFWIEAVDVGDTGVISEVARASSRIRDGKARHGMAFLAVAAILIALSVAAAIGVYDGSFNEVANVWGALSMPLGGILGSYIRAIL